MPSSSFLTINLDIVRENLQTLIHKHQAVMPLVKGNAYGTEPIQLSHFLESCGVPMIGVSHVNEAIHLRENGISLPLFVISAPPFETERIIEYNLTPAVNSFEEVDALSKLAKHPCPVHVNINTGMNRLGVRAEEALDLIHHIQNLPNIHLEGVMTHFASAGNPEHGVFTQKQITMFKTIVDQINPKPKWIHAACTTSHHFDLPFCNLARIGLSLFGFGPNLHLALSLESHLSGITLCKKDESVGYDCTYRVEKEEMRVGVIPIGYHDGFHRHYAERGYVLIGGKKAPIVGHICMDFMMIDLSEIPHAAIGDRVTLFGPQLSPETVASWGETNVRELLSCLGPRVKRMFISIRRDHDTTRLPSDSTASEEDQNTGRYLSTA